MYAGDEFYDDDITSGIEDEPLTYDPVEEGQFDDDPNPYDGTYSEE